jgi:protein-S-isoprenylcysteine O-methyltransferase Ste14
VGPLELLILIALGIAIGTALRRAFRTRKERGPDAPEAERGHLLAQIGVRVGSVLLVVSVFALVAIGSGDGSEDYSGFTTVYATVLAASVLMVGFGAFRLHQDRQAALALQPNPGESMTRCPHCAEPIQAAANVCRYCGRDVQPQT